MAPASNPRSWHLLQVKRIEGTTRSPLYSTINETIQGGLPTIRAMQHESTMETKFGVTRS